MSKEKERGRKRQGKEARGMERESAWSIWRFFFLQKERSERVPHLRVGAAGSEG